MTKLAESSDKIKGKANADSSLKLARGYLVRDCFPVTKVILSFTYSRKSIVLY